MLSPHVLRRSIRAISFIAFLLLISACGSPTASLPPSTAVAPEASIAPSIPSATITPTVQPTAAAPTVAATEAPSAEATAVATAAPTDAPTAGTLALPAPLYYLSDGQIFRLEQDGVTSHKVTFEAQAISNFALAPGSNSLLYTTGDSEQPTVVLLDESGRRDLMQGPISQVTIAPDAARIAVDVTKPIEGFQLGRDASDTGVFLQDRLGGRPGLLVADTAQSESKPAQHHLPNVWSPDGSKLVVTASGYPEASDLKIYNLGDGQSVEVSEGCCEAVWNDDGKTVLVAGGVDPEFSYRGLWRVDAATGKAQQLFPDTPEKPLPLATFPHAAADGSVLAFIDEIGSLQGPAHMKLVQIGTDGTVTALGDTVYNLLYGAWAPDGSGLVATPYEKEGGAGNMIWIPSDGRPATTLAVAGASPRWGNAKAMPVPFACDAFRSLEWQPSDTRQIQPEVAEFQGRLVALGYLPSGSADGLFGDQTRDALKSFQTANNLPPNGILDCATWQVVFKGNAKKQ